MSMLIAGIMIWIVSFKAAKIDMDPEDILTLVTIIIAGGLAGLGR